MSLIKPGSRLFSDEHLNPVIWREISGVDIKVPSTQYPPKMEIYVFSYNRSQSLRNCIRSIEDCSPEYPITIVDDQSDDEEAKALLNELEQKYRVVQPDSGQYLSDAQRTGGLYNNMQFALQDARDRGVDWVLFVQDDIQLVRSITEKDIESIHEFFQNHKDAFEVWPLFRKEQFHENDKANMHVLDSCCYKRSSSAQNIKSGFSAPGLFHIPRFFHYFETLENTEPQNDKKALDKGLFMGIYAYPFMMWLPFPVAYRNRTRDELSKKIDELAGAGFHPIKYMTEEQKKRLFTRDLQQFPIAERFLTCPTSPNENVWSFEGGLQNLVAQGGEKSRIAARVQQLQQRGKYQEALRVNFMFEKKTQAKADLKFEAQSKLYNNESKNITSVVDQYLCCSCGACKGVCKQEAISFYETVDGNIFPQVSDQCQDCGMCYEVCPGHSLKNHESKLKAFADPFIGNVYSAQIGKATDQNIFLSSQSGGLVTATAQYLLENKYVDGVVVTKANFSNETPIRGMAYIARNKEELLDAQKSKYTPVPVLEVLQEIKKQDGAFALVGLPCHMHALQNLLEVNPKLASKIKYKLGLICDRVQSTNAIRYLALRSGHNPSKLHKLNFRDKSLSRGYPGDVLIEGEGRTSVLPAEIRIEETGTGKKC